MSVPAYSLIPFACKMEKRNNSSPSSTIHDFPKTAPPSGAPGSRLETSQANGQSTLSPAQLPAQPLLQSCSLSWLIYHSKRIYLSFSTVCSYLLNTPKDWLGVSPSSLLHTGALLPLVLFGAAVGLPKMLPAVSRLISQGNGVLWSHPIAVCLFPFSAP